MYTASLPSGDPHTTKIGLSVVSAAATRSRASGLLIDASAPVIGQMIISTFGSATIASRILRPSLVSRRRTTVVDGIRHPQVAGNPFAERLLRRLRRDRADASPAAAHRSAMCAPVPPEMAYTATSRPLPSSGGRFVRANMAATSVQLVEPVDTGDAELAEHRRRHRVGAGEMTGVRLGHRATLARAADLDAHDRHAALRGVVGREHQRAAVLEALDVRGDHADVGLVDEVAGEVGELEVDLVAGRRPVAQGDAEVLCLEDRTALVPALGDERDLGRRQVVAERLERVEVGVRSEQVGVAGRDQVLEPLLQRLALGARPR